MSARAAQQYATLFDCDGIQEAERLVKLSPEDRRQIERLFWRNIHSGRALDMRTRFMQSTKISGQSMFSTLQEQGPSPKGAEEAAWIIGYLQTIIQIYQQEKNRLHALAQEDNDAWGNLAVKLIQDTHRLLTQLELIPESIQELASKIGQQTCAQIAVDKFPCDVLFDTWVQGQLNYQIFQQLTRESDMVASNHCHSQPFEPKNPAEYKPATPPFVKSVTVALDDSLQTVDPELLATAIGQLPIVEQRIVIVYSCYYNFSDDEIADRMNKNRHDVQKLRRTALRELQRIMQR